MPVEQFTASVQYNDLKGSAAADRADRDDAERWLASNGLKQEDEVLIGVSFFAGENHGTHEDPIHVEFLLAPLGNYDNVQETINAGQGPIVVRRVTRQMSLAEFFGLFKRFSVSISPKGILSDRQFVYMA